MKSGDVGGLAYHYMQNTQLPAIPVQEICKVSGSTKL
jgi:hypothetical protein